MRKGLLIALCGIVVLFVVLIAISLMNATAPASVEITKGLSTMQYEIVTTEATQERGLGGRKEIPDNYAMLFVFPKEDKYGFWMKDMLTSIDIIWVAEDGTVVGIEKNVSPSTYPNAFYPPMPVRYVLETKAGFTVEHNWVIGTKVALPQTATNS